MLLSDAYRRVRTLLDDVEAVRWSDQELSDVLGAAQAETMTWAIDSGASFFDLEASVTTDASGNADLSAQKPLSITSVSLLSGTERVPLQAISPDGVRRAFTTATRVLVRYVARPALPASPALAFVWGVAAQTQPLLDEHMCLTAALALKPKEGEALVGVQARLDSLTAAIRRTVATPGWRRTGPRKRRNYCAPSWTQTSSDSIALVAAYG